MQTQLGCFTSAVSTLIFAINYPFSGLHSLIDESLDDSVLLKRARRAGANILETLPIYLVFCLLSIIEAKDISEPAFYWLILRVIHGLCYLLGITYVRTLAWLGSLGCLIVMGLSLI